MPYFLLILALFVALSIWVDRGATPIASAQSDSTIYLPLVFNPVDNSIDPTPEPTPNPTPGPTPGPLTAEARINVPPFTGWWESAIAWFGRVTPTENYADIRVGYGDEALLVDLRIADRRVWYDTEPAPANLENWDAVTLYIYTQSDPGEHIDSRAYRFVVQYNWWEDRLIYRASYQGSPSGWVSSTTPFTTTTGYRGDIPNNDIDDRGWSATFEIPYNSLDLSGTPGEGSEWRMALELHDRDDEAGTPIADKYWPADMDRDDPSTWNQIHFGLPGYTPPQVTNQQTITIRYKLNGAIVTDAHVGGHTLCGGQFDPDYFNGWGDANYSGYTQVNVQNEIDIVHWPCFSKLYITFPLNSIPADKMIVSAELVLHQFGNSDPSQAYASLIQVLTVDQDWDEASITWNNAPLATENVSRAWVDPLLDFPGVPGVERRWDLSRTVAQVYDTGQPLRLVLYSADTAQHSGKYFYSSDVDDYMPEARPALIVTYGDP